MARIVSVIPNDDHTLLIRLDNRHRIIYDMRPKLQTVRFGGLSDLARFKSVRVEHANTLVWDSICQLTIDEIVNMLER
ncbi:MAG: hypothetical protein AB1500_10850 [Bacillota bacterium]